MKRKELKIDVAIIVFMDGLGSAISSVVAQDRNPLRIKSNMSNHLNHKKPLKQSRSQIWEKIFLNKIQGFYLYLINLRAIMMIVCFFLLKRKTKRIYI